MDRVAAAVRPPARHEEARQPGRGSARASGRHPTSAPSRTTCGRSAASPSPSGSARVVVARRSEPPCFSVIAMPISAPRLAATGRALGSYSADRIFGGPGLGDLGRGAQRRQRREGHRDRAADAALDLIEQEGRGGADDVGAGPRVDPGQGVDLLGDRRGPSSSCQAGANSTSSMPVAEAVVAAQHRRLPVGLLAEPQGRGLAEPGAEAREPRLAPAAALARHGGAQRRVLLEQVVALERRRLVLDLVGGETAARTCRSPAAAEARPARSRLLSSGRD